MKSNRLNDYDHIRRSKNTNGSKNVFTPSKFAKHQLVLTPNNLNNYLESGIWYNTLSEATNVLQLMQTVSEMVNDKRPVSESATIDKVNRFLLNNHIVRDWANIHKVNENSKFDLHEKFTAFLEYTNELSYDIHVYDAINDKLNIEAVLYSIANKGCPVEAMRLMDELLDKVEDSGLIKGDKSREGVLFLIDHFAGKKKIRPVDKEYLIDLANVYYFMHHKDTLDISDRPKYTAKSILVLNNHEVVKFKDNKFDNTRIVCSILSIFIKYLPELNIDFVMFLDGLRREIRDKKILVNKQFVELFMNSIPYVSTPEMDNICADIVDMINPDTYNIVFKPAVGDTTLEDFLHGFVDGKIDKVALSKLISDFSETDKMEFEYILDIIGNPNFLDKVKDAYGYNVDNSADTYKKQIKALYILTGLHLTKGDDSVCVRMSINMMGMIVELLNHCTLNDDIRQNFSEYALTMSKIYNQTHGDNIELDKDVENAIDRIETALLRNVEKLEGVDEVAATPFIGIRESADNIYYGNFNEICDSLHKAQRELYSGEAGVLFLTNQLNIIYGGFKTSESTYLILRSYLYLAGATASTSDYHTAKGLLDSFRLIVNPERLYMYMKILIPLYANTINKLLKLMPDSVSFDSGLYIKHCQELISKCDKSNIDTGLSYLNRYMLAIKVCFDGNPDYQEMAKDFEFLKYMEDTHDSEIVNIHQAIAYIVRHSKVGDRYVISTDCDIQRVINFISTQEYKLEGIALLYYATILLMSRYKRVTIDKLLGVITKNMNSEKPVAEAVDDPFDNDYFDIDKQKAKEKEEEDKKKKEEEKKSSSKKKDEDEDEDEDDDIDDEDDDFDDEDWDDEDDEDWDTYNEDPDKAKESTFDTDIDRIMVAALLEAEFAKNQYKYYRKGQMKLFTLSPAEKIRMGLNNRINESISPYAIMGQHIDIYVTNYDRINESSAIGYIKHGAVINESKDEKISKGKITKTAKAIGKKGANVVKKSHELGQKTSDNFQQFAADFGIIKRQASSAIHKVGDLDKKYSDRLDTMFDRSYLKIKKNVANKNREAVLRGSLLPSLSSLIKLGTTAGALTALGQPILGLVTLIGGVGVSAKATKEQRQAIADELDVQQKIVEKRLSIADSDNDMESYGMLLKIKNRIIKEKARLTYKTGSARSAMRKAEWDKQTD